MASSQPDHPDRSPRESVLLQTEIALPGQANFTCRVRNISATGMMIECANNLRVGDTVTATLRGIGNVECSVARVRSGLAGLHFAEPIDPALCRKSVLAKAPDPSKDWVLNLREPYKGKRWT
jgi:hypothetical protein